MGEGDRPAVGALVPVEDAILAAVRPQGLRQAAAL